MTQNENVQNGTATHDQDDMLSSILQKLSKPDAATSPPPQSSSPQSPMGDILSSLLSNPEMLAKLPSLLSSVKPIIDMLGIGSQASASVPASAATDIQSSVAALPSSRAASADSRTALLCAMKPYLSHERQNAIDYIVKLSKLGDILKTL